MTVGRMLGLAVLGALCGCSLLLDTSEFRIDERALSIVDIDPKQVTEGAMEPVIVYGQGFTDSVIARAVVLLPAGGEQEVTIATRLHSPDGSELGLLLDLPVLPDHGPTDAPASVRIELSRGDALADRVIPLQALTELVLDAGAILDTATMAERYSEVSVTGAVRMQGTQPARLVATSAIRINGTVDASGAPADGEQPGAAGPGGCPGGAGGATSTDGEPGGCDQGGGRPGIGATIDARPGGSGAGGGCAIAGSGATNAAGGEALCSLALVPLGAPSNRGHGGGGGGGGIAPAGGGGGGGGGVLALDAPLVVLNGQLDALGGDGGATADPDLPCEQTSHGGAGGGGAGGVVLLRADTLVVTERDRISTEGGAGALTCAGDRGGAGASGRVRIDVATLQSSVVDEVEEIVQIFSRHVWQGPRLSATTPRLVMRGPVSLQVRGDAAEIYALRVDSGQPVEISGEQTMELALERGLREVCVLVQGVDPDLPESKHCLIIAVLAP